MDSFNLKKLQSLLPYLAIAIMAICAYMIIINISVLGGAINRAWVILSPFFYGFLIAYIISIPCNAVQRLLAKTNLHWVVKRKKMFSIIIVFLILLLIISLSLNLLIPAIVASISHFITYFDTYYENMLGLFDAINNLDFLGLYISVDGILAIIQDFVQGIRLDDVLTSFGAVVSVGMALFRGFLALISMIYILHEKENIKIYVSRALKAILPVSAHQVTVKYVSKLNQNFKQYIYTQTIDGCIIGVIATVTLLALGSPFFLLLGLILAVLNYIPYFGSIFGSLIAIFVVMITQDLQTGLLAAVLLLVIQQIDANIIQPRLMSGSFSLSPFLVIVSITVGGAIAGMLGMLVAIPVVSVLKDIFDNVITKFEEYRKIAPPDTEAES